MKKIDILQKVEGEVYLHYSWQNGLIADVAIEFLHYRGFEKLLVGKNPLDALVINPRICGICGHAHLKATVNAIERALDIKPTKKAMAIREITTLCELVQNHLKWFYLVIAPHANMNKFLAIQPSIVTINKIIALFGGQYPHSSYMLPGGVTCDPTSVDIYKARTYLESTKDIINNNLFSNIDSIDLVQKDKGDFGEVFRHLIKLGPIGQSYDRFIVLGENAYIAPAKILKTIKKPINTKYIRESRNAVTYRNKVYETGPLARMIALRHPLVMQLHRRFKDAAVTRIAARITEIDVALRNIEELLKSLRLDDPSYMNVSLRDGYGEGVVEAARGSLVHRIWIQNEKIAKYQIVTPTQWNLLQGSDNEPGVARRAIRGLHDTKHAELVFRSFDICSVCTTH